MAKNLVVDAPQQQSRKAGPEHQRLTVFAGRWRTEGRTAPTDGVPALPIQSSDEYEWIEIIGVRRQ